MAENSLFDVSTWIRRLGPDFKDSITPYGLSYIFSYHQIRVDEPLLRATANYWVLSQHVFHFNGIELCPTIKEFGAIKGEPEIDISFSLPWVRIFLLCCKLCWVSLLPRQIGGVFLASSTLGWSLSIFLVRPFPRVRVHIRTFFMPFAYMLL